MNRLFESNLLQTRRQFFGHSGQRLGGFGLTYAMDVDDSGPSDSLEDRGTRN